MTTEAIEILADGVPTWEYADGTRLPIIRGGDGEDPAPEGEPAADSGGAPDVDPAGDPAPSDPPADPTLEERLEQWGGIDAVSDAVAIREALQTEEGVTQLFFESARSLGYGTREIQGFIDGTAPVPKELGGDAPDKDDLDPDRVLTAAEVQQMIAEQAVKPLQEQQAQQVAAAQQVAVSGALDALKVEDPDERIAILNLGQKYLKEGDEDPEALAAAVRRGHADFITMVERQAKAYLATKQGQRDGTPTPVTGGGTTGGGEDTEDLSFEKFGNNVLKEAMRRARTRTGSE